MVVRLRRRRLGYGRRFHGTYPNIRTFLKTVLLLGDMPVRGNVETKGAPNSMRTMRPRHGVLAPRPERPVQRVAPLVPRPKGQYKVFILPLTRPAGSGRGLKHGTGRRSEVIFVWNANKITLGKSA